MIRSGVVPSTEPSFGGVYDSVYPGDSQREVPDLRRVASAAGRLSAAEMSRISRAYEDADSETKDVNAGEYLFLGNFTMQFWNAFNNWNFRYWVYLLFVGFIVHTVEHLSTYFLTKAAIQQDEESALMLASPFDTWVGYFYFIFGPLMLLLGGIALLLNPAVKHTHTIVATSIVLTLVSEFVCVVGNPHTLTATRAMPIPMVLFLACMSTRLFPSVSFLAVALYMIGVDITLVVYSSSREYAAPYTTMVWAGVLCHWFVFGLCLVGSSNLLRSQSDLFYLMIDRLQFRRNKDGSYDLGIHDVSTPMLDYFEENYKSAYSLKFSAAMDEKNYRLWARSRQTFWITRHMRWAIIGVLLLVAAMIFVAADFHAGPHGNTANTVSGVVVQVVSALVLLMSVCLTVISFGKPRRLLIAAFLFFVSTAMFSCVYIYNYGRAAEEWRSNASDMVHFAPVMARTVWATDPGLFTIIASHVSMSHIGALPLLCIDVIVTTGVIISSEFWLEHPSPLLSMADLINFIIVIAVAFLYTINLESHWRLLWAISRDKVPTSPDTYVSVEGCATEFSTKTMYYFRVHNQESSYLCLQSTRKLRDLLVLHARKEPLEWQQFICLSFDNLDHAGEGVIETRMHRLEVVINGIVCRRPDLVMMMFPRPEGNNIPRMNITLIDVGSRGDVEPYIAISKELNSMGHHCRICTHDKFRDMVERKGIEFFPMALDAPGHWQPEVLMRYAAESPSWSPGFLISPHDMSFVLQHTTEMMQSCRSLFFSPGWESGNVGAWAAVKSNPEKRWVTHAMISNPPAYVHVHIAERLGVPLHMFFPMPWSRTKFLGHPMSSKELDDNAYWRFLSYSWFDQMQWHGMAAAINEFRAKVMHIPKLSMWHSAGSLLENWGVPFSYCFSPSLFPRPPDWGPNIEITGVCSTGSEEHVTYEPPAALGKFLRGGDKPLYIGFGSIAGDLSYIYKPILEAIKDIPDLRVVLQKGWGTLKDITAEDFIHISNLKDRVFFICTPPAICPKCGKKPEARSHSDGLFCDDCVDSSSIEYAEGTWEYDILKALGRDNIAFLSSIPHTYLFPKCCAVMHHGGAGTTAMGLDFGLPTSVISFFGDQWIWGSLVQLHGAGKFLRREHVDPQAVKACLEFSITPGAKVAAKRLQESFREERKRGMGAHEGALGFQRQLPLELVTCELCRVMGRWEDDYGTSYRPRAAEYHDTLRDVGLCPVCAVALSESQGVLVTPLRTADWGRTRGGILYVHFVRGLKAATRLFVRMVQGGQTGGVSGFLIGVVAGLLEFAVFIVCAPFVFVRDSWRVATKLAQGSPDGRQHGGRDTADAELLTGLVLVDDQDYGDVRALPRCSIGPRDRVLNEEEVACLTERTQRALTDLEKNRNDVRAMAEAVCKLFERRGVGVKLTAKAAYREPLLNSHEKAVAAADEGNNNSSSSSSIPPLRGA